MKTILVCIAMLIATVSLAKKETNESIAKKLPQSLELKDELQKFKVTTTHFNYDIFGHLLNRQQICGLYSRGLKDGMAKWNDVTVAQSTAQDPNAEFTGAVPVSNMENFTYIPNEEMIKPEKFTTITEYSAYAKNLVWDMLGIETFAWAYWDELELNKELSPTEMNGKVDLAGQGSFENRDIRLLYAGQSIRNGERCAVIEYRTLNNPLELKADGMDMKGRSHYWGTIWVSLEDKQIEHAVLYEDVILEMVLPGQTQKQVVDAVREISYVRTI